MQNKHIVCYYTFICFFIQSWCERPTLLTSVSLSLWLNIESLRGTGSWTRWRSRVFLSFSENVRCQGDWKGIGNSCYYFSIQDIRSWDGARKRCRSLGGDLAVIENPDVLRNISETSDRITLGLFPYYVGLRVTVTNVTQAIAWNDGRTVDNRLWKDTPRISSDVRCGVITKFDNQLILQNCSTLSGFICQSKAGEIWFCSLTHSVGHSLTDRSICRWHWIEKYSKFFVFSCFGITSNWRYTFYLLLLWKGIVSYIVFTLQKFHLRSMLYFRSCEKNCHSIFFFFRHKNPGGVWRF